MSFNSKPFSARMNRKDLNFRYAKFPLLVSRHKLRDMAEILTSEIPESKNFDNRY